MKHNIISRSDKTSHSEHWETISKMVTSDVEPVVEIAARFVLLAIFCGSLLIWMNVITPLYWLAMYGFLETANIGYLTSRRPPGTLIETRIAATLNLLCALWFSVLPVYLWNLGNSALKLAAVALIAAMALYCVTQYSRLRHIVIFDGALISVLVIYFGYDSARNAETAGATVFSLLIAVLITIYFAVTLHEGISTRIAHDQAEKRNLHAHKMEAIGQLTGGIAHDFNNLLTVMIGNLDLYAEVDDPDLKDELAEESRQAALRAATLTSQLLSFSRKAQLSPKQINPERFLQSFVAMMRRVMPEAVTLQLELSSKSAMIVVDVNQLENALLNLVINARDAITANGVISIRMSVVENDPEQEVGDIALMAAQYCRISVHDTGSGIPADLIDAVMAPFFTTKPVGKGSGLGLSMAKGFAEQSGGALQLHSLEDQGTTIALWLPVENCVA